MFCGWPGGEAAERRYNVSHGLPVSACSAWFYQCAGGVQYPLSAVPPGTRCFQDGFVHDWDTRCASGAAAGSYSPSPTAQPSPGGPSFSPTVAPTPSATPTGTPFPCMFYGDGYYCASSAAEEAARRAAAEAGNNSYSLCTDNYFQCAAGTAFPHQPVPPGTLCYQGTFIHNDDIRCTGVGVDYSGGSGSGSGSSGGGGFNYTNCTDGLWCDAQCGRTFYQCVGGRRYASQATALGTVCYDWGQGGYLIHENDMRCLAGNQWCAANETAMRCYSTHAGTLTGVCADHFYLCEGGQPYFIQRMSEGTACYNGGIVSSNDAVCAGSADSFTGVSLSGADAWVQVAMTARGLARDSLLTAEVAAQLRVQLAAACNCGTNFNSIYITGVTDGDIDTTVAPPAPAASSGARMRRAAAAPPPLQRQSRVLTTYADLPTSLWTPRTAGLEGVEVVDASTAAGPLGMGSSALNITFAVPAGGDASAVSAGVAAMLTPDPVTGISPFTAALASAGMSGVFSLSAAPAITAPPGSSAAARGGSSSGLSGGATAGVVIGALAGAALLALTVWAGMNRQKVATFCEPRRRVRKDDAATAAPMAASDAKAPQLSPARGTGAGTGAGATATATSAARASSAVDSGRGARTTTPSPAPPARASPGVAPVVPSAPSASPASTPSRGGATIDMDDSVDTAEFSSKSPTAAAAAAAVAAPAATAALDAPPPSPRASAPPVNVRVGTPSAVDTGDVAVGGAGAGAAARGRGGPAGGRAPGHGGVLPPATAARAAEGASAAPASTTPPTVGEEAGSRRGSGILGSMVARVSGRASTTPGGGGGGSGASAAAGTPGAAGGTPGANFIDIDDAKF